MVPERQQTIEGVRQLSQFSVRENFQATMQAEGTQAASASPPELRHSQDMGSQGDLSSNTEYFRRDSYAEIQLQRSEEFSTQFFRYRSVYIFEEIT